MALQNDVQTRFPASGTATVTDVTSGNRTFTHAASAGALGVVLILSVAGSLADGVTGILYGGTAMVRQATGSDTSESNRVTVWTLDNLQGLGNGGSQTVTLQGASTTAKVAWVATLTGTAGETDAQFDQAFGKSTTTAADPFLPFPAITAGAMVYGAVGGGAAAPTSYTAGSTVTLLTVVGVDYGALSAQPARSTSPVAGGTYTFDFVAASDDYCMAAASMKPVTAGGGGPDTAPYAGGGYYPMVKDKAKGIFLPERWRDKVYTPKRRILVPA